MLDRKVKEFICQLMSKAMQSLAKIVQDRSLIDVGYQALLPAVISPMRHLQEIAPLDQGNVIHGQTS